MANLAADTTHETRPRAGKRSYVLADGVTFFAGSFVGVNAAGFLAKWADTAGHEFQGILLDGDRTAGAILGETTPADGTQAKRGRVDCSGLELVDAAVASVAQTDVNGLVYCATDNPADMSLSAGSNVAAIGWVTEFKSSGICNVELFTPAEHKALS